MANAQSTDRAPITAGVDVTEQRRLNAARERGIPWKKWDRVSASGSGAREDYGRLTAADVLAVEKTTFPSGSSKTKRSAKGIETPPTARKSVRSASEARSRDEEEGDAGRGRKRRI